MSKLQQPVMLSALMAGDSWTVLPAFVPVPGMGVLPVNSFLLQGSEPLLVDTGLAMLGDAYLEVLASEIDLDDLCWIWLSHTDADHIGNLASVLERAPKAKVVTNFLGMGKMNMLGHDLSRVHLLEPGARLELSDRTLTPVRPLYYDAPETIGFMDSRSGTFFAADSFGALLPDIVSTFEEIDEDSLRDGMALWSTVDAPWLTSADQAKFAQALSAMRQIAPERILSGHLPVANRDVERLTRIVHEFWCTDTERVADPLSIEMVAASLG